MFPANRVVQLDAKSLDELLVDTFQTRLDALGPLLFQNINLQIIYHDCRKVLLPLLYYASRIFTGQTPGQRIMRITFDGTNKRSIILNYVLSTAIPRVLKFCSTITTRKSLHTFMEKILSLISLLSFIYSFWFLYRGGASEISEKLVGLRTFYTTKPSIGEINYTGLNRELLGHTIGHLFLLLTPVIVLLRKRLSSYLKSSSAISNGIQGQNNPLTCFECNQRAILPVKAKNNEDGSNIYCYYCFHISRNGDFVFITKNNIT
ncbi:peroxisome biogenesis factor 2 [Ditylenchus destructor]|nr:peroxisome biogenesis factor 2 [Ditylenchus destructor]